MSKTEAEQGMELHEMAQFMGFENVNEMHRMIVGADLSTPEKMKAFKEWQENDGTKEGLEELLKK
jgi:hypothetical protein